jgi:rhodanese-related sulfurtransferase
MELRTVLLITLLTLLTIAAFLMFSHNYTTHSPYRITPEEAKRRIKANPDTVVLDTRTEMERDILGYYDGSVNISPETVALRHTDKKTPVIAYCNTGHRARYAAAILQGMGYTNAAYIATTYKSLL